MVPRNITLRTPQQQSKLRTPDTDAITIYTTALLLLLLYSSSIINSVSVYIKCARYSFSSTAVYYYCPYFYHCYCCCCSAAATTSVVQRAILLPVLLLQCYTATISSTIA